MRELWTVIVDGECYGFFNSHLRADEWVRKNFPVAYAQGRSEICKFINVGA